MYYGAAGPTNYRDVVRHPEKRLIYHEAGLVPWHSIRKIERGKACYVYKEGRDINGYSTGMESEVLAKWNVYCLLVRANNTYMY